MNNVIQAISTSPRIKMSFKDEILVFFLLCISGNPFFSVILDKFSCICFFVFFIVFYKPKIDKETKRTLSGWMFFLGVVFIAQYITLGSVSILGDLNFMLKIAIAILVAAHLGVKFKYVYLRVMTFLAITSLFFYTLVVVGVKLYDFIPQDSRSSMILYTMSNSIIDYSELIPRNFGMFWEPGAFSGYIIATFLFFLNDMKTLFDKYKKNVIIIGIALLTTMSTTGYIVSSIIFIWYCGHKYRNKVLFGIILIVVVPVLYYAFNNLDFMGEKITSEVTSTTQMNRYEVSHSRTGSMIVDWHYIKKHPFFGNGFALQTRYADHLSMYDIEDMMGFGNGFTGIIGTLGVVFFFFYIYFIYKNKTLFHPSFLIVIIILQLQGEQFFNMPLYLMFPFLNYLIQVKSIESKCWINNRTQYER